MGCAVCGTAADEVGVVLLLCQLFPTGAHHSALDIGGGKGEHVG